MDLELITSLAPDEVPPGGTEPRSKSVWTFRKYTGDITGLGTMRLLEAIRAAARKDAFLQGSRSEMFGSAPPRQAKQPLAAAPVRMQRQKFSTLDDAH